jgi:hypothetical protein
MLLITLLTVITVNAIAIEPFVVLEENADFIKVRFTLPEWSLENVQRNGDNWQRIMMDSGSVLAKEGYPLLKQFSQAVAIPVNGNAFVETISTKTESYPKIKLLSADKIEIDDEDVSYSFYQDIQAYKSSVYYPANIAELGKKAFIGNRNLIPFHVFPFQYNAATKELLVTKTAEFIIRLEGDKSPTRGWQDSYNYIDSVGESFFLNNRTSFEWRKQKEIDNTNVIPRNISNTVDEIQFVVDKEGIYKITYQYLLNKMNQLADSLGIQYSWSVSNVDPRFLQLKDKHGPVAIHFNGEADGSFDQQDFFEFFGDRNYGETNYYDDYTTENIYTLFVSNQLGARLAVENGGLVVSNSAHYISPKAYQHSIHLEQQVVPEKLGRSWFYDYDFYREDIWFWKKITAPNLEIVPFELQYPRDITTNTFSTKVSLFGLTYLENLPTNQYDHKASIRLNQSLVNTLSWKGQTEQIFANALPLPNSHLRHGTNYYYISLNGDTPMGDREQILLDYIDLTYWREYKTSEDFIKFTKPSDRPNGLYQFKLEGFSSNQVSLYKIGTSIFNNMQIEPFTINSGSPWTVTFQDSVNSNATTYFAVTESGKKTPKAVLANIPSNLKAQTNAADCLIITIRDFVSNSGTQLYKQVWEDNGYQVKVIDVQDIFDEFNYGIRSAESIKDFLSYAYNNWASPNLKSVVLLGDGTDDERDSSTSRLYNIIPVKKIWTYKHGATASDNWYGCIVGDDPVPDISISRINVWKPEQIIQVAQKSQKYFYEPNFNKLWHGNVTLASGGKQSDSNDIFAQQSEYIRRNRIPNYYRVSRVYTNTHSVSSDFWGVTSTLKSKLNDGTLFLQFMGHGGGRVWADYNLFNINDVLTLNNQNYAIVSSLACYCSAFDTKGASSISEALIMQPNKGAIATIGFSGLGYLYDDLDFGLALTEGLLDKNFESLGDAINFTKAKYYVSTSSFSAQQALTQGCVLLGDPNIRIYKPQSGVLVNTNSDVFAINDTLKVTAIFPNDTIGARTFVLSQTEKIINPPNELPITGAGYNYQYKLLGNANDRYQRKVYTAGYSATGEYYGFKDISVGRGLLSHSLTMPEKPTWDDSVYFKVKVSGISNSYNLYCRVRLDSTTVNTTWISIPMVRSDADSTIYITTYGLDKQTTGKEIFYKYRATAAGLPTLESILQTYVVAGPELFMADMRFVSSNDRLFIETLVKNIGNTTSPETRLKLFANRTGLPSMVLYDQAFYPLNVNEQRWTAIPIDSVFSSNVVFESRVNIPRIFPEWSLFNDNNQLSLPLFMNYQSVNHLGGVVSSPDLNVQCEIPSNLVPQDYNSLFFINPLTAVVPIEEPDVLPIMLKSGISSIPYEIKTLDSRIVDSTGVFLNSKKIKLTFQYSSTDATTQQFENELSYKVYRWESKFKKWVLTGGNVSVNEDKVIVEVDRQGIYSIFRNVDRIRPSIDVNVQDQEFTVGGYISGKGIISIILSDANGIDVFDNSIRLYIDGNEVPSNEWVKTINEQNINRIPIKFQLNLQKGSYTLIIDCKDVNGNFNTRSVKFDVNDSFDIKNLANYPNPVLGQTQDPKNIGRTRFTYVLTDDADEVMLKVFTASGRLVKTFRNLPTGVGYHEYPRTLYAWDCVDEKGFFLANGVYFYRLIAKKGNKTIEKTQKLAILK